MTETIYTASKARAQGRPGWTLSFRHPLRKDSRGRLGLKMRRGLGTADAAEADRLVAQMNTILSDEGWWNAAKRQEATLEFDPIVVDAFYDDIQAGRTDPWMIRESYLPLPGRDDGYPRVLLVGTTGAGKTTLLRHVIGSDPERDRFPSTSTAKTTVADIEIIQAPGTYAGVVTFASEFLVQASIEECIADACSAVWEGKKDPDVAERLLNHRDQKFRLSYALGSFPEERSLDEDDYAFESSSDDGVDDSKDDEDGIPDAERAQNFRTVSAYVSRVRALAESTAATCSTELGEDIGRLTGADRDAAQELFEWRLGESEAFVELVHDILDDVRRRFGLLGVGELTCRRTGWPEKWTIESDDREEFIRAVRWFASNYAPQFGRLLTPFVDGIRVKGPLYPSFTVDEPKLVLLDGQGLGHTPDSTSSVTTEITKRFADVDVILLVDSAQQPMQAAPLSVLRTISASGHQQKLAIAFTHIDQVRGSNLPNHSSKRAHVMASVTNALSNLRDALGGSSVVRSLERIIDQRCFMLGGLDRRSSDLPKGFRVELVKLLTFVEEQILPSEKPTARPIYNPDGLPLAVQAATRAFQRPWSARLGLAVHDTTQKEHWTRVKALNRRIAGEFATEYDSLRPVADFIARMTEEVSRFLDNPLRWEPELPDETDAEAVLDQIRQEVHTALHSLAMRRIVEDQLGDWRHAFEFKGKGSTVERAQEIRGIYEDAAPVPSSIITPLSAALLNEVRHIVAEAIKRQDGYLDAEMVA